MLDKITQLTLAFGIIGLLLTVSKRWLEMRDKNQAIVAIGDDSEKGDPVKPLHDFDYRTTAPISYRPFKKKQHNVTLGITKTPRSEWIEMDRGYLQRIKDRITILRTYPDQPHVVGTNAIVNPAIKELYLELMTKYLPLRYPTMFRLHGTVFENLVTRSKYSVDMTQLDHQTMLRNLAENVEDDFYFMCPDDAGEYRLQGWIACFPNGFSTIAKFGMSLRTIHQPVPAYEERLGNGADRAFQKMEDGAFITRFNWSIQTGGSDLLRLEGNNFYPEQGHALPNGPEDTDINTSYLRVEHQTLTRLPQTQAIIFCVRTYLTSLQDIRKEGNGVELADAIGCMPEKLGNYKMRPFWGLRVCAWLRDSPEEFSGKRHTVGISSASREI